ncbi:MAG: polysaccharide biosynthesis protein [Campylobacterota bacterium]|nr:polysaccharide biosynthesis protein [Campylobacterota bacterium]
MLYYLSGVVKDAEHRIVGMRQGEKLDEIMTTKSESPQTARRDEYCEKTDAVAVEDGFEYDSGSNDAWLSVEQIEKFIESEDII